MPAPSCPTCQKALPKLEKGGEKPASYPFCSPRCKLVDLGNWLGGQYVVGSSEPPDLESLDEEQLAALLQQTLRKDPP